VLVPLEVTDNPTIEHISVNTHGKDVSAEHFLLTHASRPVIPEKWRRACEPTDINAISFPTAIVIAWFFLGAHETAIQVEAATPVGAKEAQCPIETVEQSAAPPCVPIP
jgi:hypothetical protein